MANIRDGRRHADAAPLPDPGDTYFGYTRKRTWYPAGTDNGTREIVELVAGLSAPLAVALTGMHVTSKRHAIESYVSVAGEPWASLVSRLYRRCVVDWGNRIPESNEEQNQLRDMCLSVLAFENYYLDQFACE